MSYIPTVIENSGRADVQFDLPSRLLKDRIIQLYGEITSDTAYAIVQQIIYLDTISKEPIYLYIYTPGGEVDAGMAIYDIMQLVESEVHTVALGLAASMGFFLLNAGSKRYCTKHCRIMAHSVSGGTQGTIHDMDIDMDETRRMNNELMEIISFHSKLSFSEVKEITLRDKWVSPTQAIEYGFIDKIKD